jgi:hypothetical protein
MTQIVSFKQVNLTYKSLEDFCKARNMARCNPGFHSREHKDYVLVNVEGAKFACLEGLFRCTLPPTLPTTVKPASRDIALVRLLRNLEWRPLTAWDGCTVVEDGDLMFLSPEYFTQRVLITPVDLTNEPGSRGYVDDVIDYDMFLWWGN